jgi:hypothetical protein
MHGWVDKLLAGLIALGSWKAGVYPHCSSVVLETKYIEI